MAQDPHIADSPAQIRGMFDRIAPRYDLLNRLLSFRRDVVWRRKLAAALPGSEAICVIDLATGTGDVLLACARAGRLGVGVGLDVSPGMLGLCRAKLAASPRAIRGGLVQGEATRLCYADACADAVTIAFGIRNVGNVDAALREMHRILRPGGRALVLEFSIPRNPILRGLYLFYFRHVLPRLGGWISGDRSAYRYLNRTAETFPYGEAFSSLMHRAGFAGVEAHPLSFGIAALYCGEKVLDHEQ